MGRLPMGGGPALGMRSEALEGYPCRHRACLRVQLNTLYSCLRCTAVCICRMQCNLTYAVLERYAMPCNAQGR